MFQKLTVSHLAKKYLCLTEPQCPLPCSQKTEISPYLEPDESSLLPPPPVILLLRYIFISCNLRRFFQMVSFLQVFPPNPVCISLLYCVSHFPLCHPPHLIALIICGEQNKSCSFSLYEFLQSHDFPEQLSHAVSRSKLVVKRG